jgi:hypothetical protein
VKWKKVPGYLVEATKRGDIRNYLTKETKFQGLDKVGYKRVTIKNDANKSKTRFVHTLVALAWLRNSEGKEVNHKDLDKSNPKLSNLEWCTHRKNMHHAIKNGHIGGNYKLTLEQVIDIRFLHNTNLYTNQELANYFRIAEISIWRIIVNKTWIVK